MNSFLRSGICIGLLVGCFFGCVFASDSSLEESTFISRFEYSQLLHENICDPCIPPSPQMKQSYTQGRLETQQSRVDRYISDIEFENAMYEGVDYYYCVASVIDKDLMHGFPNQEGNYFCPGKFCGDGMVTLQEVIASLYRLVRPSIYALYSAQRGSVETWLDVNTSKISLQDAAIIRQAAKICEEESCALNSARELDAYMVYCSYNLGSCGFQAFSHLTEGNLLAGYANLLVKHSLLTVGEIDSYNSFQAVDGNLVQSAMNAASDISSCSEINDYDNDGISNDLDICDYTYDPYQTDTDGDGIGDVCDDDIDGDGIPNLPGVIDFSGKINPRLAEGSEDNCPDVSNQGQEDADENGVGDSCETGSVTQGFAIEADPLIGSSPMQVQFSALTGGSDQTVWNFGDQTEALGESPVHTYLSPGRYAVTALTPGNGGKMLTASLQIVVLSSLEEQVGYEIGGSPMTYAQNGTGFFSSIYEGLVQTVTWSLNEQLLETLSPDEDIIISFENEDTYFIESQAYDSNGEWVGLSQCTVELGENAGGSKLHASTLTPSLGEAVTFTTELTDIEVDDIRRIERSFGDGTDAKGPENIQVKSYDQSGGVVVAQRIIFRDALRQPHENIVTLYVVEGVNPPVASVTAQPISAMVGEEIVFSLEVLNIAAGDIDYIEWFRGDESKDRVTTKANQGHVYDRVGYMTVSVAITLKNKQIVYAQTTVGIGNEDLCRTDMSSLKCDMDLDTIPDQCDDDIDGDGIKNWIGLLTGENPANAPKCDITLDIIDTELLAEYTRVIREGADWDNCFINENSLQEDDNANGIGNRCEIVNSEHCSNGVDDDGDGWIDCADGDCRESPACIIGGAGGGTQDQEETECSDELDNDADGETDCDDDDCKDKPECQGSVPPPSDGGGGQSGGGDGSNGGGDSGPIIETGKCSQCPCPYADYGSAIWKGDRIRAILYDESGEILYRYTQPEIIQIDIPDTMIGG